MNSFFSTETHTTTATTGVQYYFGLYLTPAETKVQCRSGGEGVWNIFRSILSGDKKPIRLFFLHFDGFHPARRALLFFSYWLLHGFCWLWRNREGTHSSNRALWSWGLKKRENKRKRATTKKEAECGVLSGSNHVNSKQCLLTTFKINPPEEWLAPVEAAHPPEEWLAPVEAARPGHLVLHPFLPALSGPSSAGTIPFRQKLERRLSEISCFGEAKTKWNRQSPMGWSRQRKWSPQQDWRQ